MEIRGSIHIPTARNHLHSSQSIIEIVSHIGLILNHIDGLSCSAFSLIHKKYFHLGWLSSKVHCLSFSTVDLQRQLPAISAFLKTPSRICETVLPQNQAFNAPRLLKLPSNRLAYSRPTAPIHTARDQRLTCRFLRIFFHFTSYCPGDSKNFAPFRSIGLNSSQHFQYLSDADSLPTPRTPAPTRSQRLKPHKIPIFTKPSSSPSLQDGASRPSGFKHGWR